MYKYLLLIVLLLAGCRSQRNLEKQDNIKLYTDSVTIRDSVCTSIHDSVMLHYKIVYDTLGRIIESKIIKVHYVDTLNSKIYNKDSASQQRNKDYIFINSSGNNTRFFRLLYLFIIVGVVITVTIFLRKLWKTLKKNIV